MSLKTFVLGGTAAIALIFCSGPGFAQSAPGDTTQSAPATPNTTTPMNSDQSSGAADQDAAPTHHMHHHRHHVRHHMKESASNESPGEKQQTRDLNQQQLAKAESAVQQMPGDNGNMGSGNMGSSSSQPGTSNQYAPSGADQNAPANQTGAGAAPSSGDQMNNAPSNQGTAPSSQMPNPSETNPSTPPGNPSGPTPNPGPNPQ